MDTGASISINSTVVVMAAIIFFALGALAGFLIAQLFRPDPGSQADQAQHANDQKTAPQPTDSEKIEVARLYRDRFSSDVFYETEGKRLSRPEDVAEWKRPWLKGGMDELARLLETRPAAPSPAPPAASSAPLSSGAEPGDVGAALRSVFTSRAEPIDPSLKVSMRPIDALNYMRKDKPEKPPEKGIAEQIDDVLQEQIAGTALAERGIRLQSDPIEGVVVLVGSARYIGVDGVADAEARAAIRQAVAEWEQRAANKKK